MRRCESAWTSASGAGQCVFVAMCVGCALLLMQLAPAVARAGGPIEVTVTTTDATPTTVSASGTHLLDLSQEVTNNRGPFASLAGRPIQATFSAGNLNNLLQVSSNSNGTTLALRDPKTGAIQNFVGPTRQAAEAKLHNFLQTNLNKAFSGYQTRLNGQSGIGSTDGNPLAATALLANDAFNQFGLLPSIPAGRLGIFDVGVQASGGTYRTNRLDGKFALLNLNLGVRFNQTVGLVMSVPLEYSDLAGINEYTGGLNVGLPITLIKQSFGQSGFKWQLTPWGSVGAAANESLLSGGGVAGGGVTSSLAYRFKAFTFTLANQIGYDTGFGFSDGDYHYDTPVDQWILKNGLSAAYTFWRTSFVDAGVSYTDFLHQAGVPNYVTPTVGVGVRWGRRDASSLRIGYSGDFGSGFEDNGIRAQVNFAF